MAETLVSSISAPNRNVGAPPTITDRDDADRDDAVAELRAKLFRLRGRERALMVIVAVPVALFAAGPMVFSAIAPANLSTGSFKEWLYTILTFPQIAAVVGTAAALLEVAPLVRTGFPVS